MKMAVMRGALPARKKMPLLSDNIRAGAHFARSYASFKFLKRPRPLSAVFVVCNRCNLTCRYCNSPFLKDRELTIPEIARLFSNLKTSGIYRLGLTGGEPLLREDIGEIIALAKKTGFFTSLNSNLLLYRDRKDVFEKVDFVFTSLDGPPELHEKNRGRGSAEGVIGAIADLRKRAKNVVAITVVDEHNATGIDELIRYAEKYDFKLHFQVKGISTLAPVTDVIRGNFLPGFGNEEYRAIWKNLLALKKRTKVIASSRRYLESIIAWSDYREIRTNRAKGQCAAGFGYIYIDSEGMGYPCCLIKKTTPRINLLAEDWRTAFDGKKPCNACICGPYLQLNLLYSEPLSSLADLYAGYGS